jgi:hypothetical protein
MKSSGGGFKRPSMSKPSSSAKRPSPFKSSFKIGPKAPSMQGGMKQGGTEGPGLMPGGGRGWGWRSRPRGGCFGSLIALVLILLCVGVIVMAVFFNSTLQAIFGG